MSKTLRLILGDQLNIKHTWFDTVDKDVTYVLMELRQETDYVVHHIQKIVAFFVCMRKFADVLREQGHNLIYIKLDDIGNRQGLGENITACIDRGNYTTFEYLFPDEYRLDQQLKQLCDVLPIESRAYDTEHFLTRRDDVAQFFAGKNYLMETFYRHIRKQNGWLMHQGKPEGGRWNFDKDNRKSLPANLEVTEPLLFQRDVTEITDLLEKLSVSTLGYIDSKNFIWPTDRAECLSLLQFFLEHCLSSFGKYEDAMDSRYWAIFHSRLSFALNCKMLSPREVVDQAIEYYRHHETTIDLASIEGFVRQIIGWREFMRGIYWAKMPEYSKMNYLKQTRALPQFYWTGKTRMTCLRHTIQQSLRTAYAHHIQRLMITGNFALLAGVHPDAVDQWYLGIYIDAIEWVEITNTRGMSQFADGGIIATKPYVSSANYINKMSNYCSSCYYNPKERYSDDACPFNALYWYFLICHQSQLGKNHRMRMMYSRVDAMEKVEKEKIIKKARSCIDTLDKL